METTLLTNVYNDILRFITEEEQNLFLMNEIYKCILLYIC